MARDLIEVETSSGRMPVYVTRPVGAGRRAGAGTGAPPVVLLYMDAPGTPWGCVGFCMGGRFGMRAAEGFGDEVAAASLIHPSRLVTSEPDSPHTQLAAVTGGLYLGLGENDHAAPPTVVGPLRQALAEAHVEHRLEIIPQAEHGYAMPSLPAYNHDAAEQAWAGTLELLHRRLPAG